MKNNTVFKKKSVFVGFITLFLFVGQPVLLCAQEQEEALYTHIEVLSSRNPAFKQYQKDVQEANKAYFGARDWRSLVKFYSYTAEKKDTLLTVAARCSVRYDTLATLNAIDQSTSSLEGRTLLLPTLNGLFIPEEPQNSVDIMLEKEHSVGILNGAYPTFTVLGRTWYFIPDGKFSPTDRAYFLDPGLTLPLEKSVLTSSFGMRVSPISGRWLFHKGIDMAAPMGSAIFACKGGTVTSAVKMDPTYGNYIIVDHSGGMTSLYAHMSEMLVKKGDFVSGGQQIGKVGTTGLSTGPHLHFEIRLNGELQDPQKYLQNL